MSDTTQNTTLESHPDKAAIKAELEATRSAFHELLASLSAEDWKKKSANPAWRVGQLMWHIPWGAKFYPRGVEECRKGKGMNPPQWLTNPLNSLMTRFGSRNASPEVVAKEYDRAHEAILASLDTVKDDEWQKGATSFGVYNTIESTFHSVSEHFKEHQADILTGLGRA